MLEEIQKQPKKKRKSKTAEAHQAPRVAKQPEFAKSQGMGAQ